MPLFMHQWVYKDTQVKSMVTQSSDRDRENVVRIATEAFDGTLHNFYFTFGDYDGMSISEFQDNETALACLMSIIGQGRLKSVKTTVLFTNEEAQAAMKRARTILKR
jgi:uncharacterized protein with GYD domain